MTLPTSLAPYTDIYFLRAVEILEKLELNPFVRAQIFLRQGPGSIHGLLEATEIIQEKSHLLQNGGKISFLKEGSTYSAGETVMLIEGRAQDVIPLETVLLGVISAETTKHNDHHDVDLAKVTERMAAITSLVGERPVFYFGARHWRYNLDAAISQAAFAGGAKACSTAAGAETFGNAPVGTIPHSLENIFAWKYGRERAVVESTKAFDRYISPEVARIALVDYNNRELDDSLLVAQALGKNLFGVRVDTAGENYMQGITTEKGVTVAGVKLLRETLNQHDFEAVKIILSSGFGNISKVKSFVEAEKELRVKLFDGLGVGNIFDARIATMDIVGVGESLDNLEKTAKVGRSYHPNSRLV